MAGSVEPEVIVESADSGQTLARDHQRRVGEVHGQINVLAHQLTSAHKIGEGKVGETQRAAKHKLPQMFLSAGSSMK